MALERTMGIIKPEAVSKGYTGLILATIEKAGLKILDLRMETLTKARAKGFYAVHKKRPFYERLVNYMTTGPVVLFVLEGEDAISQYRKLMGPTDATQAPKSTLRGKFGSDITHNACHGSDGPDTADFEIGYIFGPKMQLKRKQVKKAVLKAPAKKAPAEKKVAVKKAPAKKAPVEKKEAVKKAPAKKAPVEKKEAVKKAPAKKAPVEKKEAVKKAPAKKAPVEKKEAVKKAPAKKAAVEKKEAVKKAPAKKAPAVKKEAVKKAPAKKAAAEKKEAVKKAPAKKKETA